MNGFTLLSWRTFWLCRFCHLPSDIHSCPCPCGSMRSTTHDHSEQCNLTSRRILISKRHNTVVSMLSSGVKQIKHLIVATETNIPLASGIPAMYDRRPDIIITDNRIRVKYVCDVQISNMPEATYRHKSNAYEDEIRALKLRHPDFLIQGVGVIITPFGAWWPASKRWLESIISNKKKFKDLVTKVTIAILRASDNITFLSETVSSTLPAMSHDPIDPAIRRENRRQARANHDPTVLQEIRHNEEFRRQTPASTEHQLPAAVPSHTPTRVTEAPAHNPPLESLLSLVTHGRNLKRQREELDLLIARTKRQLTEREHDRQRQITKKNDCGSSRIPTTANMSVSAGTDIECPTDKPVEQGTNCQTVTHTERPASDTGRVTRTEPNPCTGSSPQSLSSQHTVLIPQHRPADTADSQSLPATCQNIRCINRFGNQPAGGSRPRSTWQHQSRCWRNRTWTATCQSQLIPPSDIRESKRAPATETAASAGAATERSMLRLDHPATTLREVPDRVREPIRCGIGRHRDTHAAASRQLVRSPYAGDGRHCRTCVPILARSSPSSGLPLHTGSQDPGTTGCSAAGSTLRTGSPHLCQPQTRSSTAGTSDLMQRGCVQGTRSAGRTTGQQPPARSRFVWKRGTS